MTLATRAAVLLVTLIGPPAPERPRLEADVRWLAMPELAGRSGDGARMAADALVERLQGLGLEPAFGDSYSQPFIAGDREGRNVGARLVGADPKLRDEWLIVSAHYDHLGVRGGRLYPGADDNATGVAMALEVARCLAEAEERPSRSVLILFFDLEEEGLLGSRHLVREPPVPLEQVGLFVTADMLGRSLAGVCGDFLFVIGTDHAPGYRPWIDEAAEGLPLTLGVVGTDLLAIDRSDYGPFRLKHVPYLFFSTGESPVYHTSRDVADTIDYEKLTASTRLILRVVRIAAEAGELPAWETERRPWLGEALAIRGVLSLLLEHADQVEVPGLQRSMIRTMLARIDEWEERGTIGDADRAQMVRVVQILLFTVL